MSSDSPPNPPESKHPVFLDVRDLRFLFDRNGSGLTFLEFDTQVGPVRSAFDRELLEYLVEKAQSALAVLKHSRS